MPRPKSTAPAYCFHIGGQARVALDGKTYYLGTHGSKESWAKYNALLAEYNANGQKMPETANLRLADSPITVRCVTGEFRQAIATKYANNEGRTAHYLHLCKTLESEYGNVPAEQFGPRRLSDLRELLIDSGNCRRYINTQARSVVAIFKHAASRELIPAETLIALQSLEPLRAGQSSARESRRVEPVDIEHVRATAKHLSPPIRAMLRVQLGTAMRTSEIFKMRPMDIDRSCQVWVYRPESHKNSHRGKSKAVPITGDAREALIPYLLRPQDSYCFSPKESLKWHHEQRAAKRVTPPSCGNREGTNRKLNPKRSPGDMFSKDSFRVAIRRAAKTAKVPHWTPYQIRHLAATVIRDALGVEPAQALLGHSRPQMTEHYARLSLAKATEATRAAPSL